MVKSPLNLALFPRLIISGVLMARGKPGEGHVNIWMPGAGSVAPFLFAGRTNKQFRFEWFGPKQCHRLQCPLSVWNDGMNRELLDQLKLSYPLIPEFVPGKPVAAPAPEPEPETVTTGTTETVVLNVGAATEPVTELPKIETGIPIPPAQKSRKGKKGD